MERMQYLPKVMMGVPKVSESVVEREVLKILGTGILWSMDGHIIIIIMLLIYMTRYGHN